MTDWRAVPTFGGPDARLPHVVRPSAYGLISREVTRLAVVHTATGSYLPGGGILAAESPEAAIRREAHEECGLTVAIGPWQRAAVDHVTVAREGAHFEKRCTFRNATALGPPVDSIEPDHQLTWLAPDEALVVLTPPSHQWAVAEWLADHPAPSTGTSARPIVHKAAACVVRSAPHGPELLVFQHPVAGVQIPKGSVEPGERPEDAALRELAEESGITIARVVRQVGRHVFEVGAGPAEVGPPELHLWHTFVLVADEALRDRWVHQVTGSEVEAGLSFEYFWLPVVEARRIAPARFHPSIDALAQVRISASTLADHNVSVFCDLRDP